MKRVFTIIIAVLAAGVAASAQDEAFGWICQEKDPVYSAMAGASMVSSSNIAGPASRNPAAIPFSEDRFGAGASWYSAGGDDVPGGSICAGVGFRIGRRVGMSVAGNYNMGAEYEVMDDLGNRSGTFKTSSMLFSAGIGVKVSDLISFGVNLKYVAERLQPSDNPGAFASDIYALFRLKGFGVSVAVANLGTKVKDGNGNSFNLPASARIGAGYARTFASRHFVEANVDADYYFSGKFAAAAGAQYGFNDHFFVRAGYRYGGKSSTPSYASVGLGIKFFGIHIDASYLFAGPALKNTFSAGLRYSF